MAFLAPRFTNDIFLSYARVDNQPSPGEDEGWVDLFKKTLEIELAKRVGRAGAVNVWMDTRRLASNQFFDDEIERQIEQSGIFVALTSRGYIHPDSYCRKEIDLFHRKAQTPPESLRVGTRSRIFNAMLYNIPYKAWPTEFVGISSAVFYETHRSEFGDPSRFGSETFETQIKELADDIYALLADYKATFETPAPPQPQPLSENAPTVFLADTVDGLGELRTCIVNRLKQEGIRVAGRIPPPYAADEHDRKAAAEMSAATLSVHLLDSTPGQKFIEGESGKTFLQRQAELGLEHAKSQLIWVPPSPLVDIPSIKDEGYRGFLTDLEQGKREKESYSFARVSDSGVPGEIVNRVKQLLAPKPSAASAASAALLETHRKDQLHALALYPLLLGKAFQPYINPDEDDPRKSFERFQALVSEISVLIIIFGQVTGDWVIERLNASLQVAGTINPPMLKLCGIYAPPGGDDDARRKSLSIFPGDIPILYFTQPETLASQLDRFTGGRS